MLPLRSAFLVVAVSTRFVHGQDFYGPGLGGMSYHPYPSRNAYIPTGRSPSLAPLPVREPPHSKQQQPLLHDFHTPVQKGLGFPPQFPVKDIGINGAYPGPFNGPFRDLPPHGGFSGVHEAAKGFVPHGALDRFHAPIRNFGHHALHVGTRDPTKQLIFDGAYGDVPLKNVAPLGGFGGQLPPAVKDIDVSAGPVPNALTVKNLAPQNPATGILSKDTLHGSRFGAYPGQIGKDIGYPAHGALNGHFFPKEPVGDYSDHAYGPALDKTLGGFGGQRISEPFLTPVGRFSGGYEYHRVPLALVQGSFIGHHFGRPVVHGIVKAGVPVSLARGW